MNKLGDGAKWILTMALGFAAGAITAMTHGHPTAYDFMKDGMIAMLPSIGALQLSLKKDLDPK